MLAAVVRRDAFFSRPSWAPDGHSALSPHLAVADAYCGKKGHVSSRHDLAASIAKDRRLVRMPFERIIGEIAGTVDSYCASVDRAALNNENSLMLTMTWALKMAPQLSPGGLARVFGGLRLALLAVFAYAILLNGGSIMFAVLAILISADVLQDLRHFQYTIYPFFAPILLGLAGLYAILLRCSPAAVRVQLPLCVGLGVITAFCANMRSSHLPLYALFFLLYVLVLTRREPRRSLSFSLGAVACFAVGYAIFGWVLIRPLIPDGPHTNNAHHVVAHPLVLGLALPPSDLSRREGIVWNDEAGLTLARRVIPEATYLGPDYERALFRYYGSLWRKYPGEMIGIYWSKLAMAGTGMFAVAWLNGIALMILYIGALVASVWVWRRNRSGLSMLFCLLSLAAVALMLEAVAVVPDFRLMYQAYLLIYTGVARRLRPPGSGRRDVWTGAESPPHRSAARRKPLSHRNSSHRKLLQICSIAEKIRAGTSRALAGRRRISHDFPGVLFPLLAALSLPSLELETVPHGGPATSVVVPGDKGLRP